MAHSGGKKCEAAIRAGAGISRVIDCSSKFVTPERTFIYFHKLMIILTLSLQWSQEGRLVYI